MSASLAAEKWIRDTLAGDADLVSLIDDRIYSHIAPEDAVYPYVLFQQMAGSDVSVNGAYRVQTNLRYLIKVVTQGGKLSDLDPIVDRIYQILHAQHAITTDNGIIQAAVVTGPYTAVEPAGDTYYPIRGLFLRISA